MGITKKYNKKISPCYQISGSLKACRTSTLTSQYARQAGLGRPPGYQMEVSQGGCWPLSRFRDWTASPLSRCILFLAFGQQVTHVEAPRLPWVWCSWSAADALPPGALACTAAAQIRPGGTLSSCRSKWADCRSWQTWRRDALQCWLC